MRKMISIVLYLSLLGLFLFEMLFEARARYLYTYVPLFIMIGTMGIYDLSNFMNQLISKKDKLKIEVAKTKSSI